MWKTFVKVCYKLPINLKDLLRKVDFLVEVKILKFQPYCVYIMHDLKKPDIGERLQYC